MKIEILGGDPADAAVYGTALVVGAHAARSRKTVTVAKDGATYVARPHAGGARVFLTTAQIVLGLDKGFTGRRVYSGGTVADKPLDDVAATGKYFGGTHALGETATEVITGGSVVFSPSSTSLPYTASSDPRVPYAQHGIDLFGSVLGARTSGDEMIVVYSVRRVEYGWTLDAQTMPSMVVVRYTKVDSVWVEKDSTTIAMPVPASQFAAELTPVGRLLTVGVSFSNEGFQSTSLTNVERVEPLGPLGPMLSFNASGTAARGLFQTTAEYGVTSAGTEYRQTRWSETTTYRVVLAFGETVSAVLTESEHYSAQITETGADPRLSLYVTGTSRITSTFWEAVHVVL